MSRPGSKDTTGPRGASRGSVAVGGATRGSATSQGLAAPSTAGGSDGKRKPSAMGGTGGRTRKSTIGAKKEKETAEVWDIKMIEPAKFNKGGKQRLTFCNGDLWEGQMLPPGTYLPCGTGQYTIASTGSVYKGHFEDGCLHGEGETTYANGDRLVGSWLKDGCEGTLTYAEGDAYTGGLWRGMRNGYGVCEYATGVRYEGNWKKDERCGEGVLLFSGGDHIAGVWEGNMVRSGFGRKTTGSGDVYEGGMYSRPDPDRLDPKAGLRVREIVFEVVRHGRGECRYANGDVFEGDWFEGRAQGEGKVRYADGTWFEGTWSAGNPCDGEGLMRTNSWEYRGGLRFNKREGKGVCKWDDGSRYEGEWQLGQRSGHGSMKDADGATYEGEWERDIRHGRGYAVFSDGGKYEGSFSGDVPNGKGKLWYTDKRIYEGDFVDSVPQGVGSITFPWGDVFYGEVAGGRAEGQGKLTCINGDFQVGLFKGGSSSGQVEGQRTLADGSVYTGMMIDWMPHGVGTMVAPDGTSAFGMYKDGVMEIASPMTNRLSSEGRPISPMRRKSLEGLGGEAVTLNKGKAGLAVRVSD